MSDSSLIGDKHADGAYTSITEANVGDVGELSVAV
jgi:hypothetical protein